MQAEKKEISHPGLPSLSDAKPKQTFQSFSAAKPKQIGTLHMDDENRFALVTTSMTKRDKFLAALGNSIRAKRHKQKISQEVLARRAGIHRTYLADVERGTRNVSFFNLIGVAKALGTTLSGLLNGIELVVTKQKSKPVRK